MEKQAENGEKTHLKAENVQDSQNSVVTENMSKTVEETTEKSYWDKHLEEQDFDFDLEDLEEDLDLEDLGLSEEELEELDLEDIVEEEDPLNSIRDEEVETERRSTVGEQEPITSSPKNLANVERLAKLVLNGADVLKAKMCSRISGEHIAEYLADEELKSTILAALQEYLATQEIKAPTPFGTLMIALGMWTLPPLGLAIWDKYQVEGGQEEEKTSTPLNQETPGEAKGDYSDLKEYQEKRKLFSVNAGGFYNKTPKGTHIKVEHANEQPSPIVQEWINAKKTNREIRELLNYGE